MFDSFLIKSYTCHFKHMLFLFSFTVNAYRAQILMDLTVFTVNSSSSYLPDVDH